MTDNARIGSAIEFAIHALRMNGGAPCDLSAASDAEAELRVLLDDRASIDAMTTLLARARKERDALSTELATAQADLERARGTQAAQDVLAERRRQIEAEGWRPEHDDQHTMGELADAAACYARSSWFEDGATPHRPSFWPWEEKWWKPTSQRQMLVKAGALILAEIERLDRAALAPEQKGE